jgi:hypothetical protein
MSAIVEPISSSEATLPVCLFAENPYRLVSLWDMLSINATIFVKIGEMYENYVNGFHGKLFDGKHVLDEERADHTIRVFKDLSEKCKYLQLSTSRALLRNSVAEFERTRPTFEQSRQRLSEWFACFTAELGTRLFFEVLPHRQPYYCTSPGVPGDGQLQGDESWKLLDHLADQDGFPDAVFDAVEAGNCFALERFTACIYHLMRVAEHGLVAVARSLNVPEEKVNKGWDGCIQGIESSIKTISSTKPSLDWQDQVKKYSDLCSWFTTIKTGWRNPVSHVPRTYSEGAAKGMFSATVTLFDHLRRAGFKQVAMPSEPILLPVDVS